tara:strand:+ start:2010 stop:2801 length:792 start_codon:yes stop_codon:yes gene_type:complete
MKTKKNKHIIKKTKKISSLKQIKQNISIYWNHKMSRSHVACNITDYLKNMTLLCKKAPVTGRTLRGYKTHLFPDLEKKSETNFINYFKNKNYLDMGSGINHMFKNALLYKLIKKNYNALGMDLYKFPSKYKNFKTGSVLKTKLKNNSYDIITSQYFLYYWLDNPLKLIEALTELHRILKKKGSIRIYPVYYGNYHFNDSQLITFIEKHFEIMIYKPTFYKERVAYIYPGEDKKDIKLTDWDVPKKEKEDAINLDARTLILIKK